MTQRRRSAPQTSRVTKVVIASDHERSRAALAGTLDVHPAIAIVANGASIEAAFREERRHRPDVVVIDGGLLRGLGALACRRLRDEDHIRVVTLLSTPTRSALLATLFAGAAAYALKDLNLDGLTEAILHRPTRESAQRQRLIASGREGARFARLTTEERELYELVARGYSDPEITQATGGSQAELRRSIALLYSKLR